MDAFPAFIPLRGARVAVAGRGEGAEAKARLLAGSPAEVVRLTDARALDAAAYADVRLAFVADADADFAGGAAAAARAAGALVNVTDRPELCDFTSPAIVDRGRVVVGVGTDGAAPVLATLLRQQIEALLPAGTGAVAEAFDVLRAEVRQALPDIAARRAVLREVLLAELAADDPDGAAGRLRAALARGAPGGGRIQFVPGQGPADRLSLAAARALAFADRVVVEPGVDPAVVALARRDAPLSEASAVDPHAAAREAAEGARIVWLFGHSLPAEAVAAAQAAGVAVERFALAADG